MLILFCAMIKLLKPKYKGISILKKMYSHKNDQMGITHHIVMMGLAVLLLGAIGFAGFRIYKNNTDIKAKAYAYKEWGVYDGVRISGCRYKLPSGAYTLKTHVYNNNSTTRAVFLYNQPSNSLLQTYTLLGNRGGYYSSGTLKGASAIGIAIGNNASGGANLRDC